MTSQTQELSARRSFEAALEDVVREMETCPHGLMDEIISGLVEEKRLSYEAAWARVADFILTAAQILEASRSAGEAERLSKT